MNTFLSFGRALGVSLVLAVVIVVPGATFADSVLSGNTCNTGSTCPGAPFIGSTAFTILENGGIPQPLIDPITGKLDTVYAGDVLIYEGTTLSDLLRFPEIDHSGHSQSAILFSGDDPGAGGIPTDRQALVISITENPNGDMTLYKALTGAHEIDYTTVSPGDTRTPEPGTAFLLGATGLLMMIGLRLKAA